MLLKKSKSVINNILHHGSHIIFIFAYIFSYIKLRYCFLCPFLMEKQDAHAWHILHENVLPPDKASFPTRDIPVTAILKQVDYGTLNPSWPTEILRTLPLFYYYTPIFIIFFKNNSVSLLLYQPYSFVRFLF